MSLVGGLGIIGGMNPIKLVQYVRVTRINYGIPPCLVRYLGYLRRWYIALLPVLKPLLYKNGGPILMLQIENEYGSVLCDHSYMRWLRDLTRKELGDDVVLYTSKGRVA